MRSGKLVWLAAIGLFAWHGCIGQGSPVAGDGTSPDVAIIVPIGGSTVSDRVTVSANASDNVGIEGVQFLLDGAALGREDTTDPYSVLWNTFGSPNGAHMLSAVARDAAGNTDASKSITVTVSNTGTPPPSEGIVMLGSGSDLESTVTQTLAPTSLSMLVLLSRDATSIPDPVVTGAAQSWNLVRSMSGQETDTRRMFVLTPAGPSSGPISIALNGSFVWMLIDGASVDTWSEHRQLGPLMTSASFPSPGSPALVLAAIGASPNAVTAGNGWTLVGEEVGTGLMLAVLEGSEPQVDLSWMKPAHSIFLSGVLGG